MGHAGAGSRSGKASLNDMDRHIEKNDIISKPLKQFPEICLFRKDHITFGVVLNNDH